MAEAEEYLQALCTIFELRNDAARKIFFTEPTFDLARKWAVFEKGRIVSILTTTPLHFGWGRAVGIAGVGTLKSERSRGLARALLQAALSHGKSAGEGPAMLFAHDPRLYSDCGFLVADEVIRCGLKTKPEAGQSMNQSEVLPRYQAWSQGDPARLHRDPKRWDAWSWTLKHCESYGEGYLCLEPVLTREAVLPLGLPAWPAQKDSVWYGMKGLTQDLAVPLTGTPKVELHVMTAAFPLPPRMFMTDQF
jgi:predicted acetyltransferase